MSLYEGVHTRFDVPPICRFETRKLPDKDKGKIACTLPYLAFGKVLSLHVILHVMMIGKMVGGLRPKSLVLLRWSGLTESIKVDPVVHHLMRDIFASPRPHASRPISI